MDYLVRNIVGLIPAAGRGSRIAPLPLSKEIFPIGFQNSIDSPRPKVVGQYLLEQMSRADIKRCFIILGDGKWDIPAYFGNGENAGIDLAYSVIRKSQGTPFTLDRVYSFITDKIVALGFPDILFETDDVYCQLVKVFNTKRCDVLLGLFPTDQPNHVDLVDVDSKGVVEQICIKPKSTTLTKTWGVALWTPQFTEFMHGWLDTVDTENLNNAGARHSHGELFVGDVIQASIEAGLRVEAVDVSDKPFLDIGTPDNLIRAINKHTPKTNSI